MDSTIINSCYALAASSIFCNRSRTIKKFPAPRRGNGFFLLNVNGYPKK
ncbi:MAG: hypothetical protein LBB88_09115 [Planctomycetaceae bacterium]|nr:hypothetical protein [Planctomycetaceae bacterium]